MRVSLFAALAALTMCTGCEKKPTATENPKPAEVKPPDVKPMEPKPAGLQAAADGEVILLGEIGSLTGSEAAFGISTRNGIELALEEANASGGVKGRKLAVRVYDDSSKPEEAASATTRLITQDKVVAILGEVASSWVINRVVAEAASSGLLWSSYTRTASFLPFTPPDAFASSSASSMPLRVEMPKAASLPVSEPTSPRSSTSPVGAGSGFATSTGFGSTGFTSTGFGGSVVVGFFSQPGRHVRARSAAKRETRMARVVGRGRVHSKGNPGLPKDFLDLLRAWRRPDAGTWAD